MSGVGSFKLADAVRPTARRAGGGKGGKPERPPALTAEQVREAKESAGARAAEASNRDRLVDIGRGNQAGRQGS